MAKKKRPLKDMPVIPPEDGEVERYNANYRLNPMGHKELVVKRNSQEEQTLSELSDYIMGLIEDIEMDSSPTVSAEQPLFDRTDNRRKPQSNQLVGSGGDTIRSSGDTITNMTGSTPLASDGPDIGAAKSNLRANPSTGLLRNKYMAGSRPSEIAQDYVQAESFTGTAGLAITPMPLNIGSRKTKKNKSKSSSSENLMKSIKNLLIEWEPEFKAGDYSPGDYQMPSPTGDGVADRKPSKNKVGKHDSETKKVGEAWPRKHSETAAMCDVDENGVENKPQGGHVSKHGDPSDGHTSEIGHNWPNQPKHKGGGVGEPVEGNRYSDGGVLKGSGPEDFEKAPKGPGMPRSGAITGTKGPQQGQPMEWSPNKIGQLLGEDVKLQPLFDSYARSNEEVSLESFQELCDAHHLGVMLDESSMVNLMGANSEFMFHEHEDADGVYWLAQPLNEMQIRSPEEEANLYRDEPEGQFPEGDPDYGPTHGDISVDDSEDFADYDESLDDADDFDHAHGGGRFGGEDSVGQCESCGYSGMEETCPECGHMMLQGEGDLPDPHTEMGLGDELDDMDGPSRYDITHFESIGKFMASARAILENGKGSSRGKIAEALNQSWRRYAGNVDIRKVPNQAFGTISQMTKTFPGFNPLAECDAMNPPEGKSISERKAKKSDLPAQPGPDDMQTHGEKSLLGKSQKNTYTKTPVMKGTGKGMEG